MKKKGFTLVEEILIIVVAIAILLAIIAIPDYLRTNRARAEKDLHDNLKTVRLAVSQFRDDTGFYPARLSQLVVLRLPAKGIDEEGKETVLVRWYGPYLHEVPNDPVSGEPFLYDTSPPHHVGEVRSSATGEALNGTAYIDW